MSWEAEQWARQQRTGDPVTKAVLVGIANWMNPRGDECVVSIRRIADEVEVSTRTVQRHIAKLEDLGLLRTDQRDRDDGGQGWNAYHFPTYRPTKVSHVEPSRKRTKPRDNLTPPPGNLSGGGGDNLSPGEGDNLSRPPMTQLCHGEGDNGVTPERGKGINKTPPTPPAGGGDDGKRNRGSRIPADWKPPAIDDLPPGAKAKAKQWPAGAYEGEAEAFVAYWLGEGRAGARKLDWNKTWFNRVNEVTSRVLRDARSGVTFTKPTSGANAPPAAPLMLDSSREPPPARLIRSRIEAAVGEAMYRTWFAPSRIDIDHGVLTLVSVSVFASDYQRNNFAREIGSAMHAVLGPDAELRFHNERPPT